MSISACECVFSCFVADYGTLFLFYFRFSGNFNTFTNCMFSFFLVLQLFCVSRLIGFVGVWVTLITVFLVSFFSLNCFTLVSNDSFFCVMIFCYLALLVCMYVCVCVN